MGVLKYILISILLSLNAYSKDAFLNTSFGVNESSEILSSIQIQKNVKLLDRMNFSFGLSMTHSLRENEYSNSNNNIANSSFIGFEINLLKKNFKRKIIKRTVIVDNKIVIKKTIKNHYMNNDNGLYFSYNLHLNNFFNSEEEFGNEYSLFYEFQKFTFKKRVRIGLKSQSVNTDVIKYNLSQFFIGVSFD